MLYIILIIRNNFSDSVYFYFISFFVAVFFYIGCKVESIYLNIQAVNTHREKPAVITQMHNRAANSALFLNMCKHIVFVYVYILFVS